MKNIKSLNREKGSKLIGKWNWQVKDSITGELNEKESGEAYNIVPDIALATFARQIADAAITKDIGDNLYVAVGSDPTAVAASDTVLGTETARKLFGSKAAAAGVGSIAAFFAATEATGTHREFGLFGDGGTTTASGTVDTGILFSHVNVNVTVGATETLTVTFELTFSR